MVTACSYGALGAQQWWAALGAACLCPGSTRPAPSRCCPAQGRGPRSQTTGLHAAILLADGLALGGRCFMQPSQCRCPLLSPAVLLGLPQAVSGWLSVGRTLFVTVGRP